MLNSRAFSDLQMSTYKRFSVIIWKVEDTRSTGRRPGKPPDDGPINSSPYSNRFQSNITGRLFLRNSQRLGWALLLCQHRLKSKKRQDAALLPGQLLSWPQKVCIIFLMEKQTQNSFSLFLKSRASSIE